MKFVLIIFILITNLSFALDYDSYLGYWFINSEKVIIEIVKENKEYAGYVRWLKDSVYPKGDKMEGLEQIDRNNPKPDLRNRKVMGLKVVGNLYEKKGKLKGGWIYDSWNGKKYYTTAKLINSNRLKLRVSLDKKNIIGASMKIRRVSKEELEKLIYLK